MTDEEKLEQAEALAAHAAIEAFVNTFANALSADGIEKPLTKMAGSTHVHHSIVLEGTEQIVVRFIVMMTQDPEILEKVLANTRKAGSA